MHCRVEAAAEVDRCPHRHPRPCGEGQAAAVPAHCGAFALRFSPSQEGITETSAGGRLLRVAVEDGRLHGPESAAGAFVCGVLLIGGQDHRIRAREDRRHVIGVEPAHNVRR